MDPLSVGLFTSIGSAFKFADVAVRIAEVGSENAVFVRAIQVVRSDLEEVERLFGLESVQQKLTSTPGKLPWMKTAIHNTKNALNEIGKWVERARVEQESTGSIKFETRVRWVFSDHEKLLNRKIELSTCHQQLSNVLSHLSGLEAASTLAAPQMYGDATYFDDILARHKRTNGPQDFGRMRERKHVQTTSGDDRSSVITSPIPTSTLSSPGSPPPTYATAVSTDLATHGLRLKPIGSGKATVATDSAFPTAYAAHKDTLHYTTCETRAYRNNLDVKTIPELAGDTVIFSGTNSAGPVNPFELCASPETGTHDNNRSLVRPFDNLSEMMGDLHFPSELASNDPGPPPGYPPRLPTESNQISISRSGHHELRKRAVSETSRATHCQPATRGVLSDSLVTVHQLPSLSTPHRVPLAASYADISRDIRPMTTKSSIGCLTQSEGGNRPSSLISHQSYRDIEAPTTLPDRHYSTPAPATHINRRAGFSAESTRSWGVDTHPQASSTPQARMSVKMTRMQSQKQIMDLISSIGT